MDEKWPERCPFPFFFPLEEEQKRTSPFSLSPWGGLKEKGGDTELQNLFFFFFFFFNS